MFSAPSGPGCKKMFMVGGGGQLCLPGQPVMTQGPAETQQEALHHPYPPAPRPSEGSGLWGNIREVKPQLCWAKRGQGRG